MFVSLWLQLSDKDMGMLEERIKRSGKSRPPSAVGGAGGGAPIASAAAVDRASPDEKPQRVARVAPNQTRARKVRREFQLEIEDEHDDDAAHGVPQLVTHDDLDELLNTDVILPETRCLLS